MSAEINKAWWLGIVKQHGDRGGIQYLAEKAGTYYAKAKPAIDLLVSLKLVEMRRVGTSFKYDVTTLGHRYLNENQDELLQGDAAEKPADKPEPMLPVAVADRPRTEHETRPDPISAAASFPARPNAAEEPRVPPAPKFDGLLIPAPSDQAALKDALYTILYEKFADQVTAKELMERLNGDAT